MRWTTPKKMDIRIIKRFLIIPRFISYEREVRWLEIVYIRQQYGMNNQWFDVRFVTKKDYIKYKGEKSLNETHNN